MVNYPLGTRNTQSFGHKSKPHLDTFSRRGMRLEEEINDANTYYLVNNIAVIYKKPTPITIVKVDYPHRAAAKITEAYFQKPSTTDYNGIWHGKYIDFDAKETKNKTVFPLQNIHEHQIKHLKRVIEQNGVAFFIIRFASLEETYLLPAHIIIDFINNNSKAKSIPKQQIEEAGFLIPTKLQIGLDYLAALEAWLGVD